MENISFQAPWHVGCGGNEVPFLFNGKKYIYVWNSEERAHYYYCFDDDIFVNDVEFHQMMEIARSGAKF
jgi:hypothetical protein